MVSTASMALEKAEFRERLRAALDLNGLELKHLPAVLEDYDVPVHTAARIGRPADPLTPSRGIILTLADALGVPPQWFEVEDWRELVVGAPADFNPARLAQARGREAQRTSREQSRSERRAKDQTPGGE